MSKNSVETAVAYTNQQAIIEQLTNTPEQVSFNDVIAFIDDNFAFTPTAFTNGKVENEANQNNGSCKLLALGQYLKLTNEQTLALFGSYYRDDVIGNPSGTDHANIRNFMQTGAEGVTFELFPLESKN
ncbi:MAG TPA: hypothetical protein DGF36_06315 [Alteromonas sp.]|jgi:DNA-binding IscR family transcriptional regulator|nr:hypothetical protein [Alteromonas sp.]HCV17722.1 hypothetical protein [Alteromonas sp.]|tara:strand:- start:213 stop:596 length:384 start_codon:yes stop_codon:yes gene_type:complete